MKLIVLLSFVLFITSEGFSQTDFNNTVKQVAKNECKYPVKSRVYFSTQEGFCSGAIILNEDSTYMRSTSCENRSFFQLGNWKIVGDSIKLFPEINKSKLICEIKIIDPKKSTRIKIHVLDKAGKPYESFGFSLFNDPKRFKDTIQKFYVSAGDIECDSCENKIFSNYNGQFLIEAEGYKYLELEDFSVIQNARFAFPTKNLPAEFSLTVDFNEFDYTNEIQNFGSIKPVKLFYNKKMLQLGEVVFEVLD